MTSGITHNTAGRKLTQAEYEASTSHLIGGRSDNIVRSATIVVAANDASDWSKAQADYLCDGTDDDVQIQAAIDALTTGRTWVETVKLIGNFTLAATVALASYTRLDLTEAILTAVDSLDDNMIENSELSDGNTNIQVLAGLIDGNKANQSTGSGVLFRNVDNLWVDKTHIKDCKVFGIFVSRAAPDGGVFVDQSVDVHLTGLVAEDCTDINIAVTSDYVSVTDCISHGSGNDGIRLEESRYCNCNGNISYGNTGSGLNSVLTHYSTYAGNTSYNNVQYGIEIVNSAEGNGVGNTISANTVFTNGVGGTYSGIYVSSSDRATIVGNTSIGNTGEGITTTGGEMTISGNDCYDNTQGGIGIGGDRNNLTGNTCIGNGSNGIYGTNTDYNTIVGNTCMNNAGDGIRATGSSSHNIINANNCGDDQGTPTQTDGITTANTADYNIITNNKVRNNTGTQITNVGTHDIVRNNEGYVASGDVVTITKAIDHADLTDGGDATAYEDFDDAIPAGSIVKSVKCDFTEAFNSDDTTTLTMMIGYAGTLDAFNTTADPGENAFNHTTDVFWGESDCQNHIVTAAKTPRVTFTEDDDGTDIINSANAAGKVTITITYMKA